MTPSCGQVRSVLPCPARADKVVLMANGRVAAQGTYPELLAAGVDFHAALRDDAHDAAGTLHTLCRNTSWTTVPTSVAKGGDDLWLT